MKPPESTQPSVIDAGLSSQTTRGLQIYLVLTSLFFLLAGISWFRHADGPDFAHFYAQARLIRQYPPSQFYDPQIQGKVQRELFGEGSYGGHVMPFIHPPFVMALLFPLGLVSYHQARVIWTVINLMLVLWLPWWFFRLSPHVLGKARITVYLVALAFYPFLVCLWQGQLSLIVLCLITGAYLRLRDGKEFQSGVFLGLAFVKFHLVYLLAGLLLLKQRTKCLLGLACSLGLLMFVSVLWLGPVGIQNYFSLLQTMSQANGYAVLFPERMQNWIGQLYLLGFRKAYTPKAAMALAFLAFTFLALLWKNQQNLEDPKFGLRFGATVLLCLLASPYLLIHDLSLLFLTVMLCVEFLLASQESNWQSWALWILLASSPPIWFFTLLLADSTHVQLGVIWMSAVLWLLMKLLRKRVKV